MSLPLVRRLLLCACLAFVFAAAAIVPMSGAAPAEVSADMLGGLKWRNIGPFHGGRIASVTGAIGQPGVFYAGTAGRRHLEDHQRRRRPGSRSSTSSRRSTASARFRSRRPIRTSSTPAAATRCRARRRRDVQVHGRRQDVDAHRPRGHDEDQQDRRRSEGSRISSSPRRRAMRVTPARASIARRTAARRGRTCCTRRTRTARATSSTPTTCRT